jgi:hypothetical protein
MENWGGGDSWHKLYSMHLPVKRMWFLSCTSARCAHEIWPLSLTSISKVQRWGFTNRTHARLLIGLYSIRITVLIPMLMFWTFEGIGYIKTTCRFIYLKQDKLQAHYFVFWMCIMLLHYIWLLLSRTVIFNAITFPFIVAKTRRNLDRSQFESYPFKV